MGFGEDDGHKGKKFGCDCVGEIHEIQSSVIAYWRAEVGTSVYLFTVRCIVPTSVCPSFFLIGVIFLFICRCLRGSRYSNRFLFC